MNQASSELLLQAMVDMIQKMLLLGALQIKENAAGPLSRLITELTKPSTAATCHHSAHIKASLLPKTTGAKQQPSEVIDLTDGDSHSENKRPRVIETQQTCNTRRIW